MGVGERDHQALKKVIAMQQAVGIKTSLLSPKEIREIQPRVSIHDLAAGEVTRRVHLQGKSAAKSANRE
jgi:hypothetical protein